MIIPPPARNGSGAPGGSRAPRESAMFTGFESNPYE